jgi:hypothetical protein
MVPGTDLRIRFFQDSGRTMRWLCLEVSTFAGLLSFDLCIPVCLSLPVHDQWDVVPFIVSMKEGRPSRFHSGGFGTGEPNAVSNAIGYAKHRSRSHDAVIRVYDSAGNVRRRFYVPPCRRFPQLSLASFRKTTHSSSPARRREKEVFCLSSQRPPAR